MKPLFSEIDILLKKGEDFAYICSFSEPDRVIGIERLFTSGISHTFQNFEEMRDSIKRLTPVILTFGMVSAVYPALKVPFQKWPNGITLLDSEIKEQEYIRKTIPTTVSYSSIKIEKSHMESVKHAIEKIKNGEILQVVLSSEIRLGNLDLMNTLEFFMDNDRSSYVFLYKIGKNILLGSSPENLVKYSQGKCQINPIAGTIPLNHKGMNDELLAEELLSDEKELLEHRMLVDLARNDLGKVSIAGTVKVTKAHYVQKFASVMHILSNVESEIMDRFDSFDLLKAVFPAGTVSGAPKERALEIIIEYETTPRGPYSGTVGVCSPEMLDMALIIRSLYTIDDLFVTRAGGGIVKDSIPDKEYREVIAKAQTVVGGVQYGSIASR
ncbi:MAG: chorismate-binding protein [Thermoplasmataceae archaeon]